LQLSNGLLTGGVYDQPIIQEYDLLDANRPVIHGLTAQSSGAMSIGSDILISINADQAGYIFTPSSHVNNVPLSASNIQAISRGPGDYD